MCQTDEPKEAIDDLLSTCTERIAEIADDSELKNRLNL